jgi:hypothetical protein
LVIRLSESDDLVEVEDDDVGDETNGDHGVDKIAIPKGISGTPNGLFGQLSGNPVFGVERINLLCKTLMVNRRC